MLRRSSDEIINLRYQTDETRESSRVFRPGMSDQERVDSAKDRGRQFLERGSVDEKRNELREFYLNFPKLTRENGG